MSAEQYQRYSKDALVMLVKSYRDKLIVAENKYLNLLRETEQIKDDPRYFIEAFEASDLLHIADRKRDGKHIAFTDNTMVAHYLIRLLNDDAEGCVEVL